MPEALRLVVRVGEHEVDSGTADAAAPSDVPGGLPLEVEVGGLEPGAALTLSLGGEELELEADDAGVARWRDPEWLQAAAGILRIAARSRVRDGAERAVALALRVRPTKLAEESLLALIADLESLAPGLAGELGGHTEARTLSASTPEAVLEALEAIAGAAAEAAVWIRRRPLARARARMVATPAARAVTTHREEAWLARRPAVRARAAAVGAQVAVRRDVRLDLDLPENRGVLWLFDHLARLADDLEARLEQEATRLEAGREAREAFLTARGNLWSERDEPRLRAVQRRRHLVAALREDVVAARVRAGLPESLPRAPLRRSRHVESHPGYWGLYRAFRQVEDLRLGRSPAAFVPIDNLDRLYETWCAVKLARAVAEMAGVDARDAIRLDRLGWFVQLAPGEVLRAPWGDSTLSLHYEPVVATWDEEAATGPLVRLTRGAPLRPDLVLHVERPGALPEVHVFDAKHRLDRASRDGAPVDALRDLWWKYGEDIGHRATRLPAPRSLWVLFPGPRPTLYLPTPAMAEASWSPARLRGGALALRPGLPASERRLKGLLELLLGAQTGPDLEARPERVDDPPSAG